MSFSSIELWHRISAAGLATPTQCRSWAAEAVQSVDAPEATEGMKLLQRLIECQKLTKHQARILAGQSDQPLRFGPWIILEPLKDPVWQDWYAVADGDTSANDPPLVAWARWLDQHQLEGLRGSAPGLNRGRRLAVMRHDRLQQVFPPEMESGRIFLRVAPLSGKLLVDACAAERPTESFSRSWIRQLAEALGHLHRKELVHGRVLPDRVYLTDKGLRLAMDPLCTMTVALGDASCGVVRSKLGDLRPEQFLAPEFLTPGQVPTMASDVFALGCVWWWLLTGAPPAAGDTAEQILKAQAGRLPELPTQCNLPEPLALCLQHCLARNLTSRFATATDFCHAFDAALAVVASSKKVASPATQAGGLAKSDADVKASEETPAARRPDRPSTSERTSARPTQTAPSAVRSTTASPAHSSIAPAQRVTGSPAAKKNSGAEAAPDGEPEHGSPAVASSATVAADGGTDAAGGGTMVDGQETQPTDIPRKESQPLQAQRQVMPGRLASAESTLAVRRSSPQAARRRRKNKWLVPVVAGCGFVMVLLVVLKLSGALQPTIAKRGEDDGRAAAYVPRESRSPDPIPPDPRLDFYQIVESGSDRPWIPPRPPDSIPIDLLPPGGQLFVSFRPSELLSSAQQRRTLEAFGDELNPLLADVGLQVRIPLEDIAQVTIAFYSPVSSGGFPQFCVRCALRKPQTLASLQASWSEASREDIGDQVLLLSSSDRAYYIAEQPLVDAQSVQAFSVGPTKLMREVAELHGAPGPLTIQIERLWRSSDRAADFVLLASTPFLLTEGRGLMNGGPTRVREKLRDLIGNEMRAALIQMDFEPDWYFEASLAGASDQEAGRLKAAVEGKLRGAPVAIEEWFVSQSPHPYWRALAFRFPHMLRTLDEYTRFGVEDGVAVMNAYMPPQAATNILLASWIAVQDGAVLEGNLTAGAGSISNPPAQPLTVEQYLARPIRLSFDQEPIEVALRLIGEEANDRLPPGTPQLRFVLDGDAFEKAGITRNQQLSDFKIDQQPVRAALTEVAKRGNPVPTVTDTREEDQKLIWVLADDPESPGSNIVSLTTRTAATSAGIVLPAEFAPP